MAISKRMILIGSALSCLLMGSVQIDTSLAAERPDFSGSWKLNEQLSENPRDKMMEQRKKRYPDAGSSGRDGAGMGDGGMRGDGKGSGGRDGTQERIKAMAERIQSIEIAHRDPQMDLRFADGREWTVFTDGRAIEDDFEGGIFEAKARWKGGSQVVVKAESTYGGKLTETYELSENGQQLYVTTKMEGDGRRPNITFRRVYDKALVPAPSSDTDGS